MKTYVGASSLLLIPQHSEYIEISSGAKKTTIAGESGSEVAIDGEGTAVSFDNTYGAPGFMEFKISTTQVAVHTNHNPT